MTRLASAGNLLLVWRHLGHIKDEYERSYHLAFYHPDYGWRACKWKNLFRLRVPEYVILFSERLVWIVTDQDEIVLLSIGDEVTALYLRRIVEWERILYADEHSLWFSHGDSVKRLRLLANGLPRITQKRLGSKVFWMRPLEDGVWVLRGENGLSLRSPSLREEIPLPEVSKELGVICNPPFFVGRGDKAFFYTDDPRRKWHKMPLPLGKTFSDSKILFFAQSDKTYYVAIYRHEKERTEFYRFKEGGNKKAEFLWAIPTLIHHDNLVVYNGFVCIAHLLPITIDERADVPENHGFLVWNPRWNIFYTDIPSHLSVANAEYVVGKDIRIPVSWLHDREECRL